MRLQLSPEDEAFREEMRTFFTTQARPGASSRARNTSPMPPYPMRRTRV